MPPAIPFRKQLLAFLSESNVCCSLANWTQQVNLGLSPTATLSLVWMVAVCSNMGFARALVTHVENSCALECEGRTEIVDFF